MAANRESPSPGEWYEVEMVVPTTKKFTGRCLRVIKTEEGDTVFIFQGRVPFAVEDRRVLSVRKTKRPATGVMDDALADADLDKDSLRA